MNFDKLTHLHDIIKKNIHTIVAYSATLYFFEIMYFMFVLLILYGKAVSAVSGIFLSILLAIHVIFLYSKENASRLIHLVILDIHAAIAVSYLASIVVYGSGSGFINIIFTVIRSVLLVMDIPMIILLTDDETIQVYKKPF